MRRYPQQSAYFECLIAPQFAIRFHELDGQSVAFYYFWQKQSSLTAARHDSEMEPEMGKFPEFHTRRISVIATLTVTKR